MPKRVVEEERPDGTRRVAIYDDSDNIMGWNEESNEVTTPDPILTRLESLENEVRGMRQRAADAQVTNADAAKVKNAIVG